MKATLNNSRKGNNNSARKARNTRFRLPAIAAVGGVCTLTAGTGSALELGDIRIQSNLGQPLRASIAYALNPSEEVQEHCIFLKSGLSLDGLPLLSRARIKVAGGNIVLSGGTPIREPMLSMQLTVSCPQTAKLTRNYTLMFNPASRTSEDAASRPSPQQPAVARSPATASAKTDSSRAASRMPATRAALAGDAPSVPILSRYQVQPGDTLSEIVSRIKDRPAGLWRAVGHVFAANPDAFIDGDMNLIKAGSWLDIPDLYAAAGIVTRLASSFVAEASSAVETPASEPAHPNTAIEPANTSSFDSGYVATPDSLPETPALAPAPELPRASDLTKPQVSEPAASPLAEAIPEIAMPADSIRPGAVVVGRDIPVSASGTTGIDASTPLTATFETQSAKTGGRSWQYWLGGSGIALILGLLLFGRRIRGFFGSPAAGTFADMATSRSSSEEAVQRQAATDYAARLIDESRRNRKLTLDADLTDGSGLRSTPNLDVSQDFGYDTRESRALSDADIAQLGADENDTASTDIVPLLRVEDSMILEREVPPDHGDDSDDNDLSMMIDMSTLETEQLAGPFSGGGDVEFPALEGGTGTLTGLTMTEEIDLATLERDYEEELTQTQAINEEVARAALEIAESMEAQRVDKSLFDGETVEASIIDHDLTDLTAALPSLEETDLELTGETARLPNAMSGSETAELTARLPSATGAVNDDNIGDLDATGIIEDPTANMPSFEIDATMEMDAETARANTKKNKKKAG